MLPPTTGMPDLPMVDAHAEVDERNVGDGVHMAAINCCTSVTEVAGEPASSFSMIVIGWPLAPP